MKKKFNLKKRITCLALSGVLATMSTQIALAATPTTVNNVDQVINQARDISKNQTINQFRKDVPKYVNVALQAFPNAESNTFTLKNPTVEQAGKPTIDYQETVYIGHSTLHNYSNTEQTLTTQSFSETVTDTVSTSTTHAVGTSVTASSNFQIPFVGETGIAITASYDFSQNKTNTNSKAVTTTGEPQRVIVPANGTVEVDVYLRKASVKGDVNLKGQLVGSESGVTVIQALNTFFGWIFAGQENYSFDLQDYALKYGGDKGNMQDGTYFLGIVPNADGSINVAGKGTYEANVGADLVVITRDVTTGAENTFTLEGSPIMDKGQAGEYPSEVEYTSRDVLDPSSDGSDSSDDDTDSSNDEKMVTLYKDDNYHGTSQKLGVGKYTYTDFSWIGNDALSSLEIPKGLKVILYENADFTGQTKELTTTTDLYTDGFNDKTSAIEIIDLNAEEEKMVTLYKDDNYHGTSQKLGVGKYHFTDFSKIGNDALSSLEIPKGLKVILYENEDFTGQTKELTSSTDLYVAGFNDRTSSIEIIKI